MRRIIATLDVGSNSIKLVVGEIYKNKLNILAALEVPSRGIKKGYVVNPESTIEALKELFDKAYDMIGIKVSKVIVNVPAFNTECFMAEGKTTITSENKVIKSSDIVSCMQACVYNQIASNKELVSVIPTFFNVNGETTKNPLNMIGENLLVKSVIVTIPKKNVSGIVYCLQKIGIETIDITISALGDYYEYKIKDYNKQVGAIVNIGDATTTVSIINRGVLTKCEVLEIGGSNIDNDLAYVYKLTKGDAKTIKEKLALAHDRLAQPNEYMIFTDKTGSDVKINQYNASEIVKSRIEEILNLAKKQINLLTKKEISYIILTGGLTEITDFELVLEEIFGPKAEVKRVYEIGVRDNKYSTAVGMIKYYNSRLKLRNKDFSIFNLEEQEELSGLTKKTNLSDNSLLGKLFGYFFDN
ncbi:MAG: cell division protein FtsA [Bacilli bacterium]|nr:cell division protein FtsA [Bacilli bacterium]